jgi:hypothetical protein
VKVLAILPRDEDAIKDLPKKPTPLSIKLRRDLTVVCCGRERGSGVFTTLKQAYFWRSRPAYLIPTDYR